MREIGTIPITLTSNPIFVICGMEISPVKKTNDVRRRPDWQHVPAIVMMPFVSLFVRLRTSTECNVVRRCQKLRGFRRQPADRV